MNDSQGYFIVGKKEKSFWLRVPDHHHKAIQLPKGTPKCVLYVLMTLLEICASCG